MNKRRANYIFNVIVNINKKNNYIPANIDVKRLYVSKQNAIYFNPVFVSTLYTVVIVKVILTSLFQHQCIPLCNGVIITLVE